MFPGVDRSKLEEALNYAAGDLDVAVDKVIAKKNEEEGEIISCFC